MDLPSGQSNTPPANAPEAPSGRAPVTACWSCQGPVEGGVLFCPSCGAVQAPGDLDHFRRLGIKADFHLDLKALEKAYFALQRKLHPDRFATKTGREKMLSQQQATALNDAYETLKDPLTRAIYLANLRGLSVFSEGCNALTDPVILMEAMELREALAKAETVDDADRIRARTEDDIRACEFSLGGAFSSGDLAKVSPLITRMKYLRKLVDETRVRRQQLREGP